MHLDRLHFNWLHVHLLMMHMGFVYEVRVHRLVWQWLVMGRLVDGLVHVLGQGLIVGVDWLFLDWNAGRMGYVSVVFQRVYFRLISYDLGFYRLDLRSVVYDYWVCWFSKDW
ncbi:MAG: hypothetical protein AAGJ35_12975, partial [Myxococcota bacterium]